MQSDSSSDVVIRGVTKEDYDFIVRVLDRWWGGPSPKRAHPMFFHEFGQHALIAELPDAGPGEAAVGFLLGFHTGGDEPTGYIHLVGIHPNHRRRNVGHALYQAFMERCQAAGLTRIKAITTVGHDGPISFHTALGFKASEEPDYAGAGRPRVVFVKDL